MWLKNVTFVFPFWLPSQIKNAHCDVKKYVYGMKQQASNRRAAGWIICIKE